MLRQTHTGARARRESSRYTCWSKRLFKICGLDDKDQTGIVQLGYEHAEPAERSAAGAEDHAPHDKIPGRRQAADQRKRGAAPGAERRKIV